MDMTATLTDQLADARAKHTEGARLQKAASDMLRDVARELHDAGWKGKDIAVALEVSQQRVSQLLAPPKKKSVDPTPEKNSGPGCSTRPEPHPGKKLPCQP